MRRFVVEAACVLHCPRLSCPFVEPPRDTLLKWLQIMWRSGWNLLPSFGVGNGILLRDIPLIDRGIHAGSFLYGDRDGTTPVRTLPSSVSAGSTKNVRGLLKSLGLGQQENARIAGTVRSYWLPFFTGGFSALHRVNPHDRRSALYAHTTTIWEGFAAHPPATRWLTVLNPGRGRGSTRRSGREYLKCRV